MGEVDTLFWLRVLFWTLAALIALGPARWALPLYLVSGHLDLSGPTIAPAAEVGAENAVKVLLLPMLLLLRRGWRCHCGLSRWTAMLWILLGTYSALAVCWSSFSLPALKMVAYLAGYALAFRLFRAGWSRGELTRGGVVAAMWASLGLAAIQTWVVPGWMPGTEGRFTAFVSPQSFAAFLLCVLAVLLFGGRMSAGAWIHATAAVVGIFLSGSRYVLLGAGVLLAVACAVRLARSGSPAMAALRMAGGLAGIAAAGALFQLYLWKFPESRLGELVRPNPFGWSVWERSGTWAWRLGIYRDAVQQLAERDAATLLFGSGTSSGAEFRLARTGNISASEVDANRVLHNEFLRAAYEWGVLGFLLLAGFVASLLRDALCRASRTGGLTAWAAVATFPGLLLGLAVENLLSASSTAGGLGYALVLAFGFSSGPQTRRMREPHRTASWPPAGVPPVLAARQRP